MAALTLVQNQTTLHTPCKSINDYPEIMKVGDVKAYLGIGTNAAYELTHNPRFPTLRFGNSIRVRRDKFMQFLDELENGLERRA